MHFDQNIIFVVVAAIIGISRLVSRITENAREQQQRRNRKAQDQSQQRQPSAPIFTRPKSDEERVREFLEALGQPAGTTPPSKIQPRTDIPPRPVAPIPPPPLSRSFPPVLLKPVAEKVRRIFRPAVSPAPTLPTSAEAADPGSWLREEEKIESAAAKFEAATQPTTEYGTSSRQTLAQNWRDLLRSRDSIRAALILREVLGPPRAVREVEAI
jgi:hypothetical protein